MCAIRKRVKNCQLSPKCVYSLYRIQELFLYEREAEKYSKFKNMRRTFILDTAQDHENSFFFSPNVHQWNIAFSAAHKQVCFRFFHLLYFFLADQDIAANSTWRICAFEWFLQLHTPNTKDYVLEAF